MIIYSTKINEKKHSISCQQAQYTMSLVLYVFSLEREAGRTNQITICEDVYTIVPTH